MCVSWNISNSDGIRFFFIIVLFFFFFKHKMGSNTGRDHERGCGIFMVGGVQDSSGHNTEQPGLIRAALSKEDIWRPPPH